MQTIDAPHEIFPVGGTQAKGSPSAAVSVYAVRRPDKQWGLLAINKDPMRTARLSLQFNFSGTRQQTTFVVCVDVILFSCHLYWSRVIRIISTFPTIVHCSLMTDILNFR